VEEMTSTAIWIAIGFSSLAMAAIRLIGYFIPASVISRDRILRINRLIPIVLLAALVAVQTMTTEGSPVIDHRIGGLVAGAVALYFKRSFLTVMIVAGTVGALLYNFS
jgi:branched-subunit amino acid transport protein AzlD